MRFLTTMAWIAVPMIAFSAYGSDQQRVRSNAGTGQLAEAKNTADLRKGAPAEKLSKENCSNTEGQIGDCSRCYVELWNLKDPTVRFRFCGVLGTDVKKPCCNPVKKALEPRSPDGPTPCSLCSSIAEWGDINRVNWRDYKVEVGANATVFFGVKENGETNKESLRGPHAGSLEKAMERLGLASPFPLAISCQSEPRE